MGELRRMTTGVSLAPRESGLLSESSSSLLPVSLSSHSTPESEAESDWSAAGDCFPLTEGWEERGGAVCVCFGEASRKVLLLFSLSQRKRERRQSL